MTTQDLKTNRTEIIEAINDAFGEEKLKSVMSIMKDIVEIEGKYYSSWEIILDEIKESDLFQNRKMKTADYLAEINNHEPFNLKKHYANKN